MDRKAGDRDLFGAVITVLGGSGMLGTHVVQELLSRGARVRIASRNPMRAFHLRPLGGLGTVQFVRCDVTRPDTVKAALYGAEAVVNLVGAFSGNLDAVQGQGVGKVAALARNAGAKAFVHVSAVGADSNSDVAYAKSKGDGEAAVLDAFPSSVIIRPSIMFGPHDAFLTRFAGMVMAFPFVPVVASDTRLQPVFAGDVARAISDIIANPSRVSSRIYEMGGPDTFTMAQLIQSIMEATGRERTLVPLPDFAASAIATLTGWLPGAPITRSQLRLLRQGNVTSGDYPGLDELGIEARPLHLFLEHWLVRYRKRGRFSEPVRAA